MSNRQICQVAFAAIDGPGLRDWYANVFGLVKSGKVIFLPPSTSNVQGIPGAWEKCSWLIDQQDYFQLEFFQFWTPKSRLKPDHWQPCDIGYNIVGIAVNDFDQTLRNVCAFSRRDMPEVVGEAGLRRACVHDPEGNLVEIFERDPLLGLEGVNTDVLRPEVPAVVRTMRVSVPSLEDARQSYVDAMGLTEVTGFQLHGPKDEALWGLPGAQNDSLLVRGANFLLELVEYQSPQPKPWPANYSIADQGIMNIALGYRDRVGYDQAFERALTKGMTPNGKVTDIGVFRVMYVNDRHGFSIEMLNARKAFWSISGFNSHEPYVENEITINAPAEQVWHKLTDHAAMGDWSILKGRLLREGNPHVYGTGAVRELTAPGLRIIEEITEWKQGSHFAYELRSGAPFIKHRGDIFVNEDKGITRVRWAIRFESWIPFSGKITARLLQWVFGRDLRKLKSNLEH